jgi:Tol biopolymer transport system component
MLLAIGVAVIATLEPAQASFPGKNGKIAFVSTRGGGAPNIYTIGFRGDNLTRLTDIDRVRDSSPSWSADGKKIVFQSDATKNYSGAICRMGIHTMNANGTNEESVTSRRGRCDQDPAFSPSGRKIVFDSFGLLTVNVNGSNRTRLTNWSGGVVGTMNAAWSPNGKKIAFNNYPQEDPHGIFTINPDGSDRTFVAAGATDPDWSPDGTEFTYVCAYPRYPGSNSYTTEVHKGNGACTDDTRLTNDTANDIDPAFSPGGGKIVFSSNRDGDRDLYIMDADGTDVRQLTNSPARDVAPDWQPRP